MEPRSPCLDVLFHKLARIYNYLKILTEMLDLKQIYLKSKLSLT